MKTDLNLSKYISKHWLWILLHKQLLFQWSPLKEEARLPALGGFKKIKSGSLSSTLVWPLESFFFVPHISSMPRSAVCALRAGNANGPEIGTGGAGHLGYLQETCAEPHTHQQVWICTIITNRRSLPPPLPFSCCFPSHGFGSECNLWPLPPTKRKVDPVEGWEAQPLCFFFFNIELVTYLRYFMNS